MCPLRPMCPMRPIRLMRLDVQRRAATLYESSVSDVSWVMGFGCIA